jgi:AraC-like DNA-binding protein
MRSVEPEPAYRSSGRLKEHGIEFSTLIEDVRRELALSYMKESNYSMTEISLLVGYSESASFTRAFRRWTGQSPQQYRAAGIGNSTALFAQSAR